MYSELQAILGCGLAGLLSARGPEAARTGFAIALHPDGRGKTRTVVTFGRLTIDFHMRKVMIVSEGTTFIYGLFLPPDYAEIDGNRLVWCADEQAGSVAEAGMIAERHGAFIAAELAYEASLAAKDADEVALHDEVRKNLTQLRELLKHPWSWVGQTTWDPGIYQLRPALWGIQFSDDWARGGWAAASVEGRGVRFFMQKQTEDNGLPFARMVEQAMTYFLWHQGEDGLWGPPEGSNPLGRPDYRTTWAHKLGGSLKGICTVTDHWNFPYPRAKEAADTLIDRVWQHGRPGNCMYKVAPRLDSIVRNIHELTIKMIETEPRHRRKELHDLLQDMAERLYEPCLQQPDKLDLGRMLLRELAYVNGWESPDPFWSGVDEHGRIAQLGAITDGQRGREKRYTFDISQVQQGGIARWIENPHYLGTEAEEWRTEVLLPSLRPQAAGLKPYPTPEWAKRPLPQSG